MVLISVLYTNENVEVVCVFVGLKKRGIRKQN
jgi:hypothetical protein